MDIFVKVDGQKIVLPTNMKVVTGSENFVKLIFTLATDWDNMSVKAIFTQVISGERIDTKKTLDEDNSCYIPSTLGEGRCTLTLYGVGGIGGSTKATTNAVDFIVVKQNYDPEDDSGDDDDDDDDSDLYVATNDEVKAYLGIT